MRRAVKVKVKDNTLQVIARARKVNEMAAKEMAHRIKASAKSNVEHGPKIVDGVKIPGMGIIDHGELLNSFHVRRMGPAEWKVVNTADHAGYVEFGTYRMAARRFMNPAVKQNRGQVVGVYRVSWAKVFRSGVKLGGATALGPNRWAGA